MVNDPDGYRKLDAEATLAYWTTYRDRVAHHYGYDEEQVKKTESLLRKAEGRLNDFFAENEETLDEYYKQMERRDANAAKPERAGMETLQTHDTRIAGDWMKLRGQLLSQIDALWKNVETDFNSVATPEQRQAAGGPLPIGKLPRAASSRPTSSTGSFPGSISSSASAWCWACSPARRLCWRGCFCFRSAPRSGRAIRRCSDLLSIHRNAGPLRPGGGGGWKGGERRCPASAVLPVSS